MSLKKLFTDYEEELQRFFRAIPIEDAEKLLSLIKSCKGILFFSGVGKSALVAEKIAVTMTSISQRALFLSPLEAMHGDVGMVTADDLFISFSKSGETDELLNLIPYVRNKGAKIVAITSNKTSRLAKAADFSLYLPVEKELCPFNMAPTISTCAQLILGDILAVALMKEKGFTLNEFAMNHPAGRIGKRITVRVKDLMITPPHLPLCHPEDLVIDTLVELSDKRAGCLLVVDSEDKLLGIFTDGDLRRALQKKGSKVLEVKVEEVMTKGGRSIGEEELAWEAMKVMEDNQKSPVMVLPVVDSEKRVLGLIKMHDILQSGI